MQLLNYFSRFLNELGPKRIKNHCVIKNTKILFLRDECKKVNDPITSQCEFLSKHTHCCRYLLPCKCHNNFAMTLVLSPRDNTPINLKKNMREDDRLLDVYAIVDTSSA